MYKLIFQSTNVPKVVLLLQDNAPARWALATQKKVRATGHIDTGFSLFPCVYKQTLRPYSPDLAPSGYHLFPRQKRKNN